MNKTKRHSGHPPPHVGWWNASAVLKNGVWRWWDGVRWSMPAYEDDTAETAANVVAESASIPDWHHDSIEWTNYWPKGARVPRINPETGEVTGKGGAA